jgi:hypothetical protein
LPKFKKIQIFKERYKGALFTFLGNQEIAAKLNNMESIGASKEDAPEAPKELAEV